MFDRPRCRSWKPLITQQHRLRNLIKISGYNIQTSVPSSQVYFTLHLSPILPAIYVSESLVPHGSSQSVDWGEINDEIVTKSNLKCICIRIWEDKSLLSSAHDGFLAQKVKSHVSSSKNSSTSLFMWGVHFSGLLYIREFKTDWRCSANTLVFHMNGGMFISPRSLSIETLTSLLYLNVDNKDISNFNDNNHDQLGVKLLTSLQCAEYYSSKADVIKSYNLRSLLILQQKQRKYISEISNGKDLMKQICIQCPHCIELSRLSKIPIESTHNKVKTLNQLIFQENYISPMELYKAEQLKKNIETLQYRLRILKKEYAIMQETNYNLNKQLHTSLDDKIEHESWLMTNIRNLSKTKENLIKQFDVLNVSSSYLIKTDNILTHRKYQLLNELLEVYPITQNEHGICLISNVPLPNPEHFHSNEFKINSAREQITPVVLSVSLGYVAHVVNMASVILNIPLRNPIKHEGSRSRITNVVKEIPNTSREFPLYSRATLPSNIVIYAIYLLNQNIAQFNFYINEIKCDLYATLPNLLLLLNSCTYKDERAKQKKLKVADDNKQASVFGSSIDLEEGLSIHRLMQLKRALDRKKEQKQKRGDTRLSRSAGSYSDLEDHITSSTSQMFNSETILPIAKTNSSVDFCIEKDVPTL